MTQRELFNETSDVKYTRWRNSPHGRAVVDAAMTRATRLRQRGFQRYGIKCILEAIRYDFALKLGADADGFKVNNNVASRLAREIMAARPELAGFFETRELRDAT